jgi:NADH dehydrogenase [ubiquinone] 1 alpha subcomplex assembly factor 5
LKYNPASAQEQEQPHDYDYFRREIAARIIDRLDDMTKEGGFPLALDLGSESGLLRRAICADEALRGEGGIGGILNLVQVESSEALLHRDDSIPVEGSERCGMYPMVAKEEDTLNFPDGTIDLVVSNCSLHWINDLPNLFKEVKRVLNPDGCFLFAMVGGANTLSELRSSMVLAELDRDDGSSSHVGPFVDVSDLGSLLTAAGFKLPTIDVDTPSFAYPDGMVVMEHLHRMGEGNVNFNHRPWMSVDTFLASAAIYDDMYGLDDDQKQIAEE